MGESYREKKARLGALRERVWTRDGGACFYCKKPIAMSDAQLDHVIAKSRGGPHDDTNRITSCQRCNGAKGSLSLIDWHRKVESNLKQATADAAYFARILKSMEDI